MEQDRITQLMKNFNRTIWDMTKLAKTEGFSDKEIEAALKGWIALISMVIIQAERNKHSPPISSNGEIVNEVEEGMDSQTEEEPFPPLDTPGYL